MEKRTFKRTSWIFAAGIVLLLSTIILTPISSQAQNNYWIGPPVGDWKYVWNWSEGEVPVDGENVYILDGSTVTLNMAQDTYPVPKTGALNSLQIENGSSLIHTANWTMNIGGGIPVPNDQSESMGLILGYDAGSKGIYYLSGGSNGNLNVSNVTVVGYDGIGIFNNSGTHTTGSLYIGFNEGYGEYNLYSGGTLNVNGWAGLVIGGKNYNPGLGYGVFNQYGGTSNIDHLWLADNDGTTGIYNLMDGNLSVFGWNVVGVRGQGTFNQTGGSYTAYGDLRVGGFWGNPGTGTYNLDYGNLTVYGDTILGDGGVGTFNQGKNGDGGIHQVYGNLVVGASNYGAYSLYAGQLNVTGSSIIGAGDYGEFYQYGGTHTVGIDLILARDSGSYGYYELYSGSNLNVTGNSIIGAGDYGEFYQYGGTHTVGIDLILARDSGSYGYYELYSGSNLNVTGSSIIGAGDYGEFYQYGGTHTVGSDLILARDSYSSGYYELNAGNLNVTGQSIIGAGGEGYFRQYGGTHNVGTDLILARDSGSYGGYELYAGSNLNVTGQSIIGAGGYGEFYHYGGSHMVTGDLTLGKESSGEGYYYLSGNGSLIVKGPDPVKDPYRNVFVGLNGSGYFTQSDNSTFSVTGALVLGGESTGYGRYEMNGGTLTTNFLQVGRSGNADFIQTGGTVNVVQDPSNSGSVNLGQVPGSSGTYDLSGTGALNAQSILVGADGKGIFTQWPGTTVNVIDGVVLAGNTSGTGDGTYNLNGGSLTSGYTTVGAWGTGTFNQTDGTHITGGLLLGDMQTGIGTYNLSGSSSILNATGDETIGGFGTGTFTQSGGSNTAGRINLANAGLPGGPIGQGTYELISGDLTAGFENIGWAGKGIFTQTGGTNTIANNLNLGGALFDYSKPSVIIAGTGTYNLKDGVLTVGTSNVGLYINTQVGLYGTGTFNQSGGTHEVYGTLYVGKYPGSSGTYNLNENDGPATLTVKTDTIVGYAGTGTFNQTGGTHTITGNLILGGEFTNPQYYPPGTYIGTGTYNLSENGVLSAGRVVIGSSGTGTFTQTGGSHNITGYDYGIFVIGDFTTGIGTYNLKDGSLTLVNGFEEYIGNSGKGYFNQSGGTHDASNSAVYLGVSTGGYGEYNMSGGMFKAGGLALGESGGTGKFYHSGGEVTVNNLELARQNLSNGYYELSGASTVKLTVNANLNVGVKGNGIFTQNGGTNSVGQDLNIAIGTGSTGEYNMAGGTLNVLGKIINNGIFNFTGGDVMTSLLQNYGLFKGGGTSITGSVISYGIVSPGSSPGTLTITGDYTQSPGGTLLIELGGLNQGINYDFLNITGKATLAGLLDVVLYGNFTPQFGNVFDILQAQGGLSGTFGSYDLPFGITSWDIIYGSNMVSLEYLGGQPVPVPSTLLLLASGLIGLAGLMRRKLKR